MAVSMVAVYVAGGTRTALPHAFYIPIVIAAASFGLPGAIATAVAAGILCGPVMPLEVATGTAQPTVNWLIRAAFFLAVGVVAALVTEQLRKAWAAEHAVAEERADLASARSVLLQVVSHEIRTPLTVLKGGMELLARLDNLGPKVRRWFRRWCGPSTDSRISRRLSSPLLKLTAPKSVAFGRSR